MDLRTATGTGAGADATIKLIGATSPNVKMALGSPENGKGSSKNSSVKSFNIDGLIGDPSADNSNGPQPKRRRTSISTLESNASRHSEDEEEDIDVQSDDNAETEEKSSHLPVNGARDVRFVKGSHFDCEEKRHSLPNESNAHSCQESLVGGRHGVHASALPTNSNPFAAAAVAAAAAVSSGFSPSSNLLTPFMQNAALGKFFGKFTP